MTELSKFVHHHCLSEEVETERIDLAVSVFQRFYSSVMEYMATYEAPSHRHDLLAEAYKNMVGRLHRGRGSGL